MPVPYCHIPVIKIIGIENEFAERYYLHVYERLVKDFYFTSAALLLMNKCLRYNV